MLPWLALMACTPDTLAPSSGDTAEGAGQETGTAPDTAGAPETGQAELEASLTAALEAALTVAPPGIDGIRLWVTTDSGERVLDLGAGALDAESERLAVASASKLISALVLLRLVEEGSLSLDTSPTAVLGWPEAQATLTLDHLGAFASGLPGEADCTYQPWKTLADCVAEIALLQPLDAPGAVFDYGATHLHVAARMAEVQTGEAWADLFGRTLLEPLGLSARAAAGLRYVTLPLQDVGTQNPSAAAGLRATLAEYDALLGLAHRQGALPDGAPWISPTILQRIAENHYPDARMETWPMGDYGYTYRYGFGAWLECDGPAATCTRISSPGGYGFNPWIDRAHGYRAILAMEAEEVGAAEFSMALAHEIRPTIEAWLAAQR